MGVGLGCGGGVAQRDWGVGLAQGWKPTGLEKLSKKSQRKQHKFLTDSD